MKTFLISQDNSCYMRIFCLWAICLFNISSSFANGTNYEFEIKNLNKIREDHFDKGIPFDSLKVRDKLRSNNLSVRRFAGALQALYFMEEFSREGDSIWLSIADSSWFNDPKIINEELILVDDMFRFCITTSKYFILSNILQKLNNSNFERFFFLYQSIIYLRIYNYNNFLVNQTYLKQDFIDNYSNLKLKYSDNVLSRYKVNLISMNIANFDSNNTSIFFNELIIAKSSLTKTIEDIIFNASVATYCEDDSIKLNESYRRLNIYILNKSYLPPYLILTIYKNLDLYKEMKEYLFYGSSSFYPENISVFVKMNLFLFDRFRYNNDIASHTSYFGKFLDRRYNEIRNIKESESIVIIKDIDKIEELLGKLKYFEPNWLQNEWLYISYNTSFLNLSSKYVDSSKKSETQDKYFFSIMNDRYKQIKDYDNLEITNPFINLLAPFEVGNYYFSNKDETITNDHSIYKLKESLNDLIVKIIDLKYLFSGHFTNEKSILLETCFNYLKYLQEIFLRKKEISKYHNTWKFYDQIDPANYDKIIINAQGRRQYLSFINSSDKDEIYKFDTSLIKFLSSFDYKKDLNDLSSQNTKLNFINPTIKDILIDIRNRNSANDSILINLITANDVLTKMREEISLDFDMFKQSDSLYSAIRNYENTSLCINNKNLDIKNVNSERYQSTLKQPNAEFLDTTSNILIYFLVENFSKNKILEETAYDFNFNRKYDIYACFSNGKKDNLFRIGSLDSLRLKFNYNYTKSETFYSSEYVQYIDRNNIMLYDFFLGPLKSYINPNKILKLILPNELVSIPLEYLYLKKHGVLPKTIEYSAIYRAIFKDPNIPFNKVDSTAIFSEFNYNNTYCNLNQYVSTRTRGGLTELKYAKSERENIEKYLKSKRFIKDEGTKENFIYALFNKNYKNIHLITHGIYIPNETTLSNNFSDNDSYKHLAIENSNPSERQLLLFSSDSSKNKSLNNILTAFELRYLEDLSHINLVFLSACESGMIEDEYPASIGYQGFVNNILERGAKSVIVSRWKIDDKFSQEFSSKFYEILLKNKSYSESFYLTKKYFIDLGANPSIWSSFVMVK